ncbi:potassium channel family protein [Candidatus Mycoplasma pogonae]
MLKQKLYNSKFLYSLYQATWAIYDLDETKGEIAPWVKPLKYFLGAIVAFACLISFGSLFKFQGEIQKGWSIFVTTSQVVALLIFILDYCLYFVTSIFFKKNFYNQPLWLTYLRFPFSYAGIVILLCILTSLNSLTVIIGDFDQEDPTVMFLQNFGIVKILRLLYVLRIFTPFRIVFNVFEKQGKILSYVFILVAVLIVLFALVIWNNESAWLTSQQKAWIKANPSIIDYQNNESYQSLSNGVVNSFGTSLYFTTITLTTIGYGDYVPHSDVAKLLMVILSVAAIALIAIPSGVIAAAFLQEIQNRVAKKSKNEVNQKD